MYERGRITERVACCAQMTRCSVYNQTLSVSLVIRDATDPIHMTYMLKNLPCNGAYFYTDITHTEMWSARRTAGRAGWAACLVAGTPPLRRNYRNTPHTLLEDQGIPTGEGGHLKITSTYKVKDDNVILIGAISYLRVWEYIGIFIMHMQFKYTLYCFYFLFDYIFLILSKYL